MTNLKSYTKLDLQRLQQLRHSIKTYGHIHDIDMPYRLTSIWIEDGCEFAIWEDDDQLLGWACFQTAWWNLDIMIPPITRSSPLEKEIVEWGVAQMQAYSNRSGDSFWGSVEIFKGDPHASALTRTLLDVGFKQFEWSTLRFAQSLSADTLPSFSISSGQATLPNGYTIRPLAGQAEVAGYVAAHRAAFNSEVMTEAWRSRTLEHPEYRPELDLVVVDAAKRVVGFCIGWLLDGVGQLEPIGIHPEFQGLGLGKALESAAIHTLHQHGARTLLVDHVSLNEKAISLSKKNGFKQVDNALRFYVEIAPES